MADLATRFWMKVDASGECWEWTASKDRHGYGKIKVNGRPELAHRVSWELTHGPVSQGYAVSHACGNRSCVNPSHLSVVTHKQALENRTGATTVSKSGVRGVSPEGNKWRAQVGHRGKKYLAGVYDSLHDAEAAAVALRNRLFSNNELDKGK